MLLKFTRIFFIPIVIVMMTSCSSKYAGITNDREVVYTQKSDSILYEYAKDDIESYAPMSGFYPLPQHVDSLAARIMLAKAAQKTIKLQYYTYSTDRMGILLLKSVLDAANRGVKVEFLIDDIELNDRTKELASLNAHKNVTIRVFNPTNYQGTLFHFIEMGLHADSLGRRMHNKSFVVDNSMAVFGGRNIGDEYFGLDTKNYLVDNDILVAGPFVNKLSNEFSIYFASKYSVDFTEIEKSKFDKNLYTEATDRINKSIESDYYKEFDKMIKQRDLVKAFQNKELPLYFGDATLYFDMPDKIATDDHNSTTLIHNQLHKKHIPKTSLYIMNPYFIPNSSMMKLFKEWRESGVEIYILTDSLDATDAKSVYAYYEDYQIPLLKMGVHLYEIHPYALREYLKNQAYNLDKVTPNTMLHAKTMIIDERYFIIGSRNLDPRSRYLNTEMVAIINNSELCKLEKKVFANNVLPENSYKLSLECDDEDSCKVIRDTVIEGKAKRFEGNKNASYWNRVEVFFSKMFPIRGLL